MTASGTLLRPSLILKRKACPELKVENKLGMKFFATENAWTNSSKMKLWLEEVLFDFVLDNKSLLNLDSYSADCSKDVQIFLKDPPNILLP